jgi:hypothetical protein
MGMPFLLRGRKGIFARIMGVVGVRADGYFLLFQESGQHPVEDETCVELRLLSIAFLYFRQALAKPHRIRRLCP